MFLSVSMYNGIPGNLPGKPDLIHRICKNQLKWHTYRYLCVGNPGKLYGFPYNTKIQT